MAIQLKKETENRLTGSIKRFFKEDLGGVRHELEFDYGEKGRSK